jgi:hypothetical protein
VERDRHRDGPAGPRSRRDHPRVVGQMDYVIVIRPQIITGIRLFGWCR